MIERIKEKLNIQNRRQYRAKKLLETFDCALFQIATASDGQLIAERDLNGVSLSMLGGNVRYTLRIKLTGHSVFIGDKEVKTYKQGEELVTDKVVEWCAKNNIHDITRAKHRHHIC
jgi:hypothetical protein